MSPENNNNNTHAGSPGSHSTEASEGFLLPDLCQYQSLLILIIVLQLLVLAMTVFQYGFIFDWTTFGMLTWYVQWQGMCSAVVLCKARMALSRLPRNVGVSAAFGSLLLIGFGLSVIIEMYVGRMADGSLNWDTIFRRVFLSAVIIGISLRYLYLQQQLLTREKSVLIANLSALQARIKPHFLFNTMNSIASLIVIAPDKAEKMVEDLSELLRASLRDDIVETTIAEEWWLCQRYLEIEQLRLDKRLQWSCDFSTLDQQLPIPHLSLQPIVENAIYHGIQTSPQGGYMHIHGSSVDGQVLITVKNSKPEQVMVDRGGRGNKMAINNIRHRIEQLYGSSASLTLEDMGTEFLVTLRYQAGKPAVVPTNRTQKAKG